MNSPEEDGSPRDMHGASGAMLGVLRKLSLLSGTLGEIDDWLDSRGSPPPIPGAGPRAPITLENLDEHVARDGDTAR